MSAVALIGGVVSVGGGLIQANQAKKAAAAAGKNSQVDIQALDTQARQIAQRNAQESAALEQAMTPEVPELRKQANQAVLGDVGTTNVDDYSRGLASRLAESPATAGQTPLLKAAIMKAKQDLAMGGKLDQETQNAVTRGALQKAGSVTGGQGLGLGRDITARDLGLTSLAIGNQRLQAASQLGGQELDLQRYGTDVDFNNRAGTMNAINLLQQIQNARFGRNLSAAQYGEGIARPTVGLDPSAVANLAVGNSNAAGAASANQANIYGQQSQNLMNLGGQLAGYGLSNRNQGAVTTPIPYNRTARPNPNVVGYQG